MNEKEFIGDLYNGLYFECLEEAGGRREGVTKVSEIRTSGQGSVPARGCPGSPPLKTLGFFEISHV